MNGNSRPPRAQGAPRVLPGSHVSPLCPQPSHDLQGAHGLGGESLPAEAPRGQHHECQVHRAALLALLPFTHNSVFPLNSVPGVPAAGRVKLLSLTFAAVVNSCSKLGGRGGKKGCGVFLGRPLVWFGSKRGAGIMKCMRRKGREQELGVECPVVRGFYCQHLHGVIWERAGGGRWMVHVSGTFLGRIPVQFPKSIPAAW